ncbi:hypothetical protein GCM10008955_33430 [Deinococcus malanensis]|uniref:Uncharacterized protein n=1 Tax=Deinococcus malanensis TaxID=1706855 RepID=A0ABQ2F0W0_9DEIO|nr:hypothetical protein [Deinococcus malanensis]GGK36893.1 hypothetical protein GCM10008955_33430 [Deinococcus malanensis]
MTAAASARLDSTHNQQTFDTCIALSLQMIAAIEFSPTLAGEHPTREMILAFATQIERNAQDIALMAGQGSADVHGLGAGVYAQLCAARNEPLQAAYHALHSAAFLGLGGGLTTATMLATVGVALRVLSNQYGRLTH